MFKWVAKTMAIMQLMSNVSNAQNNYFLKLVKNLKSIKFSNKIKPFLKFQDILKNVIIK